MKNNILTLTGLEKMDSKKDDVYLLGKWCLGDRIDDLEMHNNYQILNYHWDDREKLKLDYYYLKKLHDRLLDKLTLSLNKLHLVQKDKRYWQILLDPWLMDYVGIIFDRWETIRIASQLDSKFKINYLENLPHFDASFSYVHQAKLIRTRAWNQLIYQRIINFSFKNSFDFEKITISKEEKFKENFSDSEYNRKVIFGIIKIFIRIYEYCCSKFIRNYKVVFLDAYFRPFSFILLNLKLFQLPRIFYFEFLNPKLNNKKLPKRKKLIIDLDCSNKFEEFLNHFLPTDLPTSVVEYYKDFSEHIKKIKIQTKMILSANAYWYSVPKKYWIAEQSSKGVSFVSVSHGGSFPAYEEHFDFEEDISDKRCTWFKPLHDKHVQLPPNKLINLKNYYKLLNIRNSRKLLSIIGFEGSGKWAHRSTFRPVSHQALLTFDFSVKLVKLLDKEIQNKTKIRPQSNLGWNTKEMYENYLGKNMISQEKNYYKFVSHSKIILCLYPETTFSESMASGIPTILAYPENYNERNHKALGLIDTMKKAKIIFNNFDLAADHINNIWQNPYDWWNSEETCRAREEFFQIAGNPNDSQWLRKWLKFLKI